MLKGQHVNGVVKRRASIKKTGSVRHKTVRRQVTFKSSAWYEKAALSISAAPTRH
jgi:hypothetical protein